MTDESTPTNSKRDEQQRQTSTDELDGDDFYRGGSAAASPSDATTLPSVNDSETVSPSTELDGEPEVAPDSDHEDSYGVLSIVVPAYNEAETIEDTVARLDEQLRTRFGRASITARIEPLPQLIHFLSIGLRSSLFLRSSRHIR